MINILQSLFTEIGEDEAYYWMYAQFLDWGYFDHPPMIALFIKIGSGLFDGEFGVRCITILAQLICICFVWLIIEEDSPTNKKIKIFFVIVASVVMFQVFGFTATPDSPLLLFTAVFLIAYKKYLQNANQKIIFLLGLSMAGMMYSKYQGALILFLIIASNPKLLQSIKFWIAGSIGLLLFTPHLLWQIQNDFPSFQFHLVSRSTGFSLNNLLNFFPNQLANFNPFFLVLFLFLAIKNKAQSTFERGLYFIPGGFLLFFFFSSFRGHVEPHWTIAASIPMIIITYRKIFHSTRSLNYIFRVLLPGTILVCLLRITLIVDFIPIDIGFHGKKDHFMHLKLLAGDKPVIFESTYQSPSLYAYYTGKMSSSINGLSYRKTQYNMWSIEDSFLLKNVMIVTNRWGTKGQPYEFPNDKTVFLLEMDSFFTTQKIQISTDQKFHEFKKGDTISTQASVYNPYSKDIPFKDPVSPVSFLAYFAQDGNTKAAIPIVVAQDLNILKAGQHIPIDLQFETPELPPGKYNFGIALKAGSFPETFNSKFQTIQMLE